LGVVLSAGGLRGAAHLGVLRRLIAARVPIDVLVGTSAGAVVGAYYAAVGMSIDEIIADAPRLRPRHLLMHALTLRVPRAVKPWLRPLCGIVPARLDALERARFDRLHHGVSGFGVVCHDLGARKPWYFSTAESHGVALAGVVKASAAVPPVFPARSQRIEGRDVQLTDGGFSDGVPVDFPRHAGLDATHVLVSDCRRSGAPVAEHDALICVRPALSGAGTGSPRSFSLVDAVQAGEEAVTDAVLDRLRTWLSGPGPVPAIN
jgi:NTE family protein